MLYIAFAILGLIVGSFLNAVIFRLHSGKSFVSGRSECLHCKHTLSGWDLVPVFSFLYLRGRCRYCKKPISWQYPAVELFTAVVFALAACSAFPNFSPSLIFTLIFASVLIVIGVFDFKYFLILDKVVFPFAIFTLLYDILKDIFRHTFSLGLGSATVSGLLGVVLISGFFALQYYVSKGKWIGFGDVKLGLFLGLLFGWKLGLVMLMLAYFIGAVTGVVLLGLGKKQMSSQLPLGSFLAISAIIVLLYGDGIAAWYLKLIGF